MNKMHFQKQQTHTETCEEQSRQFWKYFPLHLMLGYLNINADIAGAREWEGLLAAPDVIYPKPDSFFRFISGFTEFRTKIRVHSPCLFHRGPASVPSSV